MAIDKDGVKTLRADRLIELLQTLPPDSLIWANRVRYLPVLHPDYQDRSFSDASFAAIDFVGDGEVMYLGNEESE